MASERGNKAKVTRRQVLKAGAGGALGGALASSPFASAAATQQSGLDAYKILGVKPIINAAGTITTLGGSLMPPEVLAAWTAASGNFVDLLELQDRVGESIAKLLGVEAALVTTGAAGGIVVATAAVLTYRDRSLVSRLPLALEDGAEVIRQEAHRNEYDHQIMACGVKLVDVKTREDLEQAINEKTAMMMSYNVLEDEGEIKQIEWLEVARKHKVPTLLDAAADTPPLDALWKYVKMGFDMVVFSGGKAMSGPQDAGLLLGRKDLIEAGKLNTAPYTGSLGRGMKVSKEDMVAMWAAVVRWVRLDHDAQTREWERRIGVIEDALEKIPTLTTERIVPPIANQVPHLLLSWDESRLRVTPKEVSTKLRAGDPPIATARVHGTGDKGFLISVFMLQPGEETIVAKRVREILEAGSR